MLWFRLGLREAVKKWKMKGSQCKVFTKTQRQTCMCARLCVKACHWLWLVVAPGGCSLPSSPDAAEILTLLNPFFTNCMFPDSISQPSPLPPFTSSMSSSYITATQKSLTLMIKQERAEVLSSANTPVIYRRPC